MTEARSPANPADMVNFARPRHLDGVELVSVRYHHRAFPLHEHDCYVVGTVTAGAEALTIAGNTHIVEAGDVLRLHPGEPHANRTASDVPLQYAVFYLPEACIAAFSESDRLPRFSRPVTADVALSRKLAELHRRLADTAADALEQESALSALVGVLGGQSQPALDRPRVDHKAIAVVRAWIGDHFTEDFGLIELAAIAKLSVFRLAHLFKHSTGLSPIAYRNQCRINEARRQLLTDQPIADIASQLGFADQSHLSRHFQRIVGVSPGRYRQQ